LDREGGGYFSSDATDASIVLRMKEGNCWSISWRTISFNHFTMAIYCHDYSALCRIQYKGRLEA
jgi:hypothetical protein